MGCGGAAGATQSTSYVKRDRGACDSPTSLRTLHRSVGLFRSPEQHCAPLLGDTDISSESRAGESVRAVFQHEDSGHSRVACHGTEGLLAFALGGLSSSLPTQ